MRTIGLKVGNKLIAIEDRPFNAPIPKGSTVEIVNFGISNDNTDDILHPDAAPVVKYRGVTWYTNVRTLFKNYKKARV